MPTTAAFRKVILMTCAALMGCGGSGSSSSLVLAERSQELRIPVPEFPGSSNFVAGITNPYLPLTPGKVFNYRSETDDGVETTVVEVTHDTKVVMGVTTTVVRDRVYLDGELIEDTFDWFAQDEDGNVWYFGEDSKEIEDGEVVSTEGSWEAGVDGAKPGIVMLAEPRIGMQYAQEEAEDVAEDHARVLSLKKTVEVPYGSFENCLQTMEWTPLEPGGREFKYYAPGVGLVLEVHPAGGQERNELISVTAP